MFYSFYSQSKLNFFNKYSIKWYFSKIILYYKPIIVSQLLVVPNGPSYRASGSFEIPERNTKQFSPPKQTIKKRRQNFLNVSVSFHFVSL